MSSATVSMHVVGAATASLLDNVDEDVFDNPIQPRLLEEFLSNPNNVLVVAVSEQRVVGMASAMCYVHPDKPRAMFINEVGVSPRVQGQGIGKRLVSLLLEQARTRGCYEAWVATELSNEPAKALYRSLGGKPDQEHAAVYVYPLRSSDGAHDSDA